MELDNSAQTTKKSGFSFRKRRSNSKTRKSDIEKPVDMEKDEEIKAAEITKSGEHSTPVESGDSPAAPVLGNDVESESSEVKTNEDLAGETTDGTPLSVNDSSPEGVKSEELSKGPTKKKAKRKSRSLFRRSSKNKEAKNGCEESEKKEGETHGENPEVIEAKALDVSDVSDGKAEQVVCDESGERSEVGEQSDGEYAGTASGAASEGEDPDEIKNGEEKDAATSDEKKGEQKEGTKKKKFFKRGLSLRRSKSKKNQDGGGGEEAKEEKPCAVTKEVETCEIGVSTDSRLDLSRFAAQNDIGAGKTPVQIKEDNEANHGEITEEKNTERSDKEDGSAVAKKSPAKPARTVSFAEPEHVTAELSYEGDSPSEDPMEIGEDSQAATPSPVVEAAPSKLPSEAEGETKDPENPMAEVVEDDELTEVSSVASSLVASSDAHSLVDPQESMPCVFVDAEEIGSRITLLESDEVGEGSGSRPDEPTKDACEGDELLGDEEKGAKKEGEWILLNQAYDVSGELQRMRKQTLFSVKRLCCSVM